MRYYLRSLPDEQLAIDPELYCYVVIMTILYYTCTVQIHILYWPECNGAIVLCSICSVFKQCH